MFNTYQEWCRCRTTIKKHNVDTALMPINGFLFWPFLKLDVLLHRFSKMMRKKAAILMTMVLTVLWIGMLVGSVQMQPGASDETHAVFCSTAADEPLPVSYGDLMALLPDLPCEHHQMQNDASICNSRPTSLRDQRRLLRLLCIQFTRISHDHFRKAFVITVTLKAIGHHSHRVLLTSCCMRC